MNKRLKIILATSIILLIASICLLLFRKKENQILLKIPADCTSVMIVDVRGLSTKLFLDDIGREPKSSRRIADLLPDSLKSIDWEANGLKLFDQIAFFSTEDTASGNVSTSFILQISNARKFNSFMETLGKQLHFTIDKRQGINVALCKSINLVTAWDNSFVIGSIASDNYDRSLNLLIKPLSTRKEHSIMTDTCFVKRLKSQYDIMFYSKPYHKCPFKRFEILNSNIEYLLSYINFNDGSLEASLELKTKKESILNKVFINNTRDITVLASNDSAVVNLTCNVDASSAEQLYKIYKPFEFKTSGMPYHVAWDGRLNIALNGSKIINIEYTTYEYDDNFNKIASKKIKEDKIYDFRAVAGTKEKAADSLFKLFPPVKTEMDSLLFKGSNFVITKAGTDYIAYNRTFRKPSTLQRKTQNNIEFEADYKKLILTLHDAGFNTGRWLRKNSCERISLRVNKKGYLCITGNIYFTDKEKNAVYSITESFGSK